MVEAIATERLLLRRARRDDASAIHAIMRDPAAMRYWSTPPHRALADSEAWLDGLLADADSGSDEFMIDLDGKLVGKIGLWRAPEIGFLFAPAVWGLGYASEALTAFIAHRRRCGSSELTADTDPRNHASIRLLQRHGFSETGRAKRTWLVGQEWCDSVYWRLAL